MPHWKKAFNPDYLGAYSIEDNQDLVLTIKSVGVETVTGEGGKKEDCLVCRFLEDVKPMILNKTNCKSISKIYKNPDTDSWKGKKIQVYATTTKFGRDIVDCLRIREQIPKDIKPVEIPCEDCGNLITATHGMTVEAFAAYSQMNAGRKLCLNCLKKYKEEREKMNNENNENQD